MRGHVRKRGNTWSVTPWETVSPAGWPFLLDPPGALLEAERETAKRSSLRSLTGDLFLCPLLMAQFPSRFSR